MKRIQMMIMSGLLAMVGFAGILCGGDEIPLWEVSHPKAKSKIYLAGTIHLGKPTDYPLDAAYDEVVADSDVFVFEIYRISMIESALHLRKKGMYDKVGEQEALFGKENHQKLVRYLNTFSVKPVIYQKFKPWVLMGLVELLPIKALGFAEDFGREKIFTAIMGNRPGESLESVALQVDAISGCDETELRDGIVAMIDDYLGDQKDFKKAIEHLSRTNLSGWAEAEAEMKQDSPSLHKHLLLNRNVDMTKKILDSLLNSSETRLVLVGALHYIGEDSVNKMLEKEGCTVRLIPPKGEKGFITLLPQLPRLQITTSPGSKDGDHTNDRPATLEEKVAFSRLSTHPAGDYDNATASAPQYYDVLRQKERFSFAISSKNLSSGGFWWGCDPETYKRITPVFIFCARETPNPANQDSDNDLQL